MAPLTWDEVGQREFETGVDRGVLYPRSEQGDYPLGVAWNGLTGVTESPSGAESNPQYADNIKYLDILSAEELGLTIEAFTYPDEWSECDGSVVERGVSFGQQRRRLFGLAYRTKKGNDVDGADFGYKLHLVYGGQAAPSEKAYTTVNDSPEAITFSWECTTNPIALGGDFKPTALITLDSTEMNADILSAIEDILFGTDGSDPRLPLPEEILALTGDDTPPTVVDMSINANKPTFVEGTGVITLPAVTGVQWKINGVNKAAGAQPALNAGQTATVLATADNSGNYVIGGDPDFQFTRPA